MATEVPPLVIELTGVANNDRLAERAILSVSIYSAGPSQDAVSDDVTETNNRVHTLFKELNPRAADGLATPDAPITQFSLGAITTSSFQPSRLGPDLPQPPRQFTATTVLDATFRDFNRLGDLAAQLARMRFVTVDNIKWHLTPATQKALHEEGRKQALTDAIKKANDYAEILGRTIVVVEVHESDIRYPVPANRKQMQVARPTGSDFSGGETLTVEAEVVQVTTTVKVKFMSIA